GKGTRLFPYTSDIPKPLVPVGDRPIVEILVRRLRKAGVRRVHMAVNHLAEKIMDSLGSGESLGIEIRYSVEERPLGTVGPLTLLENLPDHFIVANGDVISDIDLNSLYAYHLERKALLTVAVQQRTERIDYGVLTSERDGRVTSFVEKPAQDLFVSMGIYVFAREVLRVVPKGVPFGFDNLVLSLLERKARVFSYPYSGFWLDIGRPGDYERAIREIDKIEAMLK
ncbi:nucleoside-diphosphate-sugar pyrophosphorylase, partial [candidate division GN15 bacterium]